MLNKEFRFIFVAVCLLLSVSAWPQADSTKRSIPVDSLNKTAAPATQNLSRIDSVLKFHSPKKAAIRSAILPGLGQIYNKKYWKLPIVYGALGITATVFFYNLSTYKELKFAYAARYRASINPSDTGDLAKVKPQYFIPDINALRTYRNEFRKNIDYSVLIFIVLWGLNVADAAVDAHLKTFDVSPDLTFHIKFGHSQMAGTNGLSLVLALK